MERASPSLEPGDEPSGDDNDARLLCRKLTSGTLSMLGGSAQRELFTQSKAWGSVLRTDFSWDPVGFDKLPPYLKTEDEGLEKVSKTQISRALCWRREDRWTIRVMIGQHLLPLPDSAVDVPKRLPKASRRGDAK